MNVLTYAARIKSERERRGLTLDRVAADLGTTRQVIIRWERGTRPNTKSRRKLAAYYDDEWFFEPDWGQ